MNALQMRPVRWLASISAALAVSACNKPPPELVLPRSVSAPRVKDDARESFVAREARLLPAEVLIASYTEIFGDLVPSSDRLLLNPVASAEPVLAAGKYYGWEVHAGSLGLPDYTRDLPRPTRSNTIMVATFERLATTLCDRAAGRDFSARRGDQVVQRVFDFDRPTGPLTSADFEPRFDKLHRTFLGYPSALAPAGRTSDFFKLYLGVEARHTGRPGVPPFVAAWSAVCQGLARHPEFHHY